MYPSAFVNFNTFITLRTQAYVYIKSPLKKSTRFTNITKETRTLCFLLLKQKHNCMCIGDSFIIEHDFAVDREKYIQVNCIGSNGEYKMVLKNTIFKLNPELGGVCSLKEWQNKGNHLILGVSSLCSLFSVIDLKKNLMSLQSWA